MKKLQIFGSCAIILFIAIQTEAQTLLVSEGLNRINAEVDLAYDTSSGNALIVWCLRSSDVSDDGAILASYILNHPTGEIEISEPFYISPEGGNHQRPQVKYLKGTNGYLITWDSATVDLSEFQDSSEISQRSCRTYARTFFPPGVGVASTVQGTLSEVIDIAPLIDSRCYARPRFVEIPTTLDTESPTDSLLVFGVATDLSGNQTYSAWAAQLSIDASGSIDLVDTTDLPVQETLAIDGGFIDDGYLYAVGTTNDDKGQLNTAALLLDAEVLTVESQVLFSPVNFPEALLGTGSILPLQDPADQDVFRLVMIPAGDPAVFRLNRDFAESSLREFDRIGRNKEEVIAEELFIFIEENEELPSDYVLYASADGLVRYRKLKDTSGKPRGASRTLESGEPNTLTDISISADQAGGYIGFSRLLNRKKSAVYIIPIK